MCGNAGGANQPIASSAFQVLGAVQAPQSSAYDSNLAGSVVQLIQSAVSAQSPPPAAAAALLQILQVAFTDCAELPFIPALSELLLLAIGISLGFSLQFSLQTFAVSYRA